MNRAYNKTIVWDSVLLQCITGMKMGHRISEVVYMYICVTLRGRIKEAARTLRKQDPALPENRALNRCEVCFKQV